MRESKNFQTRTEKTDPRRSAWSFVNFDDCKKGETSAKTGCTPASGEGTKKEGEKKEGEGGKERSRSQVEAKAKSLVDEGKFEDAVALRTEHDGEPDGASVREILVDLRNSKGSGLASIEKGDFSPSEDEGMDTVGESGLAYARQLAKEGNEGVSEALDKVMNAEVGYLDSYRMRDDEYAEDKERELKDAYSELTSAVEGEKKEK